MSHDNFTRQFPGGFLRSSLATISFSVKALVLTFSVAFAAIAADAVSTQVEFKDCDSCPEMLEIPAGSVMLGSSDGDAYRRDKRERERKLATIEKAFAMSKYEVTLGEFRQFMAETKHKQKPMVYEGKTFVGCNYFDGAGYGYISRHSWQDPGYPQREDAPVVCVSWSDANAYAKWLSKKTKRSYRVPSTVEFEYAMRAGSAAPWFWGGNPSEACEYANVGDKNFARKYPEREQFNCSDRYIYTAPVGKFKPNAFGLYDIVGNAWEWTNDCWHDDLDKAPLDGSSWLEEDVGDCDARVPKGGGWISGPSWARASVRSKDGAHYRSFMLGFRLAADLEKDN